MRYTFLKVLQHIKHVLIQNNYPNIFIKLFIEFEKQTQNKTLIKHKHSTKSNHPKHKSVL